MPNYDQMCSPYPHIPVNGILTFNSQTIGPWHQNIGIIHSLGDYIHMKVLDRINNHEEIRFQ